MTTLKTVQEEKTINKTSAETTAIPNQSMKGGAPMQQQSAMQDAIINSNYYINRHICNYNKNTHQHIELDQLEDFINYLKQQHNFDKIKEAYTIVGLIEQQRFNKLKQEYYLNLAYGNYELHPSEIAKENLSNMEQQSRAMRATSRKATAHTHQAINRAIKAEQLEEQLALVDVLIDDYIKGDA